MADVLGGKAAKLETSTDRAAYGGMNLANDAHSVYRP